jgi:hypothetical protein
LNKKNTFLASKVENKHVPKKLFLFFCQNLPAIFFSGGEFLPNLKADSERFLEPLPIFIFLGGVMGKIFGGKSSASPNFAPRDGLPVHEVL